MFCKCAAWHPSQGSASSRVPNGLGEAQLQEDTQPRSVRISKFSRKSFVVSEGCSASTTVAENNITRFSSLGIPKKVAALKETRV